MSKDIENVELKFLDLKDYQELKTAMKEIYKNIPNAYWAEGQIKSLIKLFPEGQVVIKVNGQLAGCSLSIIVDYDEFEDNHTFQEITGQETFSTHTEDGDILYGIDIFIKPEYRGLRLGRRLYDYRKEHCEKLNLKGIAFGGRIPNYHEYADSLTQKQYIEKVKRKEIHDPVLSFQINNDFHPAKILKGYLEGDKASNEFAVLMEWDNIYYQKPTKKAFTKKKVIRLGLIQWQMRSYKNLDELLHQAEFFIDSVSGYRSDFALFPEFFNAPLMAENNHLSEPEAIRELAKHTAAIVQKFSEFSISYNINIITGSMPEMKGDRLFNVGHICKRDGSVERYEKLHVTPDEAKIWGMQGGKGLQTFDTDCGKIGVLICYDV
ncbi:MAG: GNAT family N-acetyltransferase, partial [Pricia sp.]|nr:GNAT family N-acetyltransferase [Pricia sp.]